MATWLIVSMFSLRPVMTGCVGPACPAPLAAPSDRGGSAGGLPTGGPLAARVPGGCARPRSGSVVPSGSFSVAEADPTCILMPRIYPCTGPGPNENANRAERRVKDMARAARGNPRDMQGQRKVHDESAPCGVLPKGPWQAEDACPRSCRRSCGSHTRGVAPPRLPHTRRRATDWPP